MVPDNTLELLEFPKLLRLIAGFANSSASGKSVLEIGPLYDKAEVETKQRQISEIRMMSQQGKPIKLRFFSDISPLFPMIKPEGAVLEAIELAEFIPVLSIAFDISQDLEERFDLPYLIELTVNLTGFPDILKILRKSIGSEGNILDSASFLLADLRKKIRNLEAKIRKNL